MSTISGRSWCATEQDSLGRRRCAASAVQRSSRPSARRVRRASKFARCSRPASTSSASTSAMEPVASIARIEAIRQIEQETGRPIGMLADLQGPSSGSAPSSPAKSSSRPALVYASTSIRARATDAHLLIPKCSRPCSPAPSCFSTTARFGSRSRAATPGIPRPVPDRRTPRTAKGSICRTSSCRFRR